LSAVRAEIGASAAPLEQARAKIEAGAARLDQARPQLRMHEALLSAAPARESMLLELRVLGASPKAPAQR
jgi:hypothetical protein